MPALGSARFRTPGDQGSCADFGARPRAGPGELGASALTATDPRSERPLAGTVTCTAGGAGIGPDQRHRSGLQFHLSDRILPGGINPKLFRGGGECTDWGGRGEFLGVGTKLILGPETGGLESGKQEKMNLGLGR